MTAPVLILGSDQSWREGLKIHLDVDGWSTIEARSLDHLPPASEKVAAAFIAAFGNQDGSGAGSALAAAEALRKHWPNLPLLFNTSIPDYTLTNYAMTRPPARIVSSTQHAVIAASLLSFRRKRPSALARFAAFEIRCDLAAITFEARLDADHDPIGPFPVPWQQNNRLNDLNLKFKSFRPYENGQVTPEWQATLEKAGTDVSDIIGLNDGAQAAVLASYVSKLGAINHVHFRFNLPHDGMEHIPFELVWDRNRESHLRELAPIARRLLLDPRQVVNRAPDGPTALTGKVLFINAPADGALTIENAPYVFSPLDETNDELARLSKARSNERVHELPLAGNDPAAVETLLKHLRANRYDVVHFAGHSVCTSRGHVYLILPGPSEPVALRAQDFAQAAHQAQVRLVILSSCESTSPNAVFRLAQAGIPAAIGFRWEVDSREAAEFTGELHAELAAGEPVGRAFHIAVRAIRASHLNSPTFASPMLIVQHEDWAHPSLKPQEHAPHVMAQRTVGQPRAHPRNGGRRPGPAQSLRDAAQGAREARQ